MRAGDESLSVDTLQRQKERERERETEKERERVRAGDESFR